MKVTKYSWKYAKYIFFLILLVLALMWNRDVKAATYVHAYWSGRYTHVINWQFERSDTVAYVFKRNLAYGPKEYLVGETTGTQYTITSTDSNYSAKEGDEYRVIEYAQDSQGFWFPAIDRGWVALENQRPNPNRSVLPIIRN